MTVESMKISWEYEREYQVEGRRVKWAISNE
jgi:hypothetical protein